jgi:hypothetical protein
MHWCNEEETIRVMTDSIHRNNDKTETVLNKYGATIEAGREDSTFPDQN